MKQMKVLAAALVAALSVASVFGAGFGLYDGDARALAMATELTADPVGPSTLFHNPAGMTELPGTQFEIALSAIMPSVRVETLTPAGWTSTKPSAETWYVPKAYVTQQLMEKVWLGVGIFSRFGLGEDWPDEWPGRYNSQKLVIETLDINPSLAVKLTDKISVAAGVRVEWFDLDYDKAIPTPNGDLQMNLKGDDWGVGYNLAAFYKATDWLSFGLTYLSQISQQVSGTADYQVAQTPASGGIDLPQEIALGLSLKPIDNLTVNAGVVYTMWSSYDELAIQFDQPLFGYITESVSEKNWNDVFRYQLGAEYMLTPNWALRAGYVYDTTPVDNEYADYIVPANSRQIVSLGVGYVAPKFSIDLGYAYLFFPTREIDGNLSEGVLPSRFTDGHSNTIGLSFTYRL